MLVPSGRGNIVNTGFGISPGTSCEVNIFIVASVQFVNATTVAVPVPDFRRREVRPGIGREPGAARGENI